MTVIRREGACERKFANLKFGEIEDDGCFAGYASLFGAVDLGGDVVLPGAFSRSIRERGASGNRIPQIQFEVLRPVGRLRETVRAVAMIPGSTEYGLSTRHVTRRARPGESRPENRHTLSANTDFAASLDELQMLCPNLEHVALVVSWFGNDLRAGHCRIEPGVTSTTGSYSDPWLVSGVERADARIVSIHEGGSAYGGTPTDRSVTEAIAEIKARGLRVTLYPFVMMDVPHGNSLPDPHGGAAQAAYPWRGRISCFPGPDQPGSADKTAAARAQVQAFSGSAQPGDFSTSDDGVSYEGSDDWGYRRLVLHYAHLAQAAGGVDAFLIGSELRGLTTLRDDANAFPFVEALCQLADEVHALLGPATAITYGADWTEYFGHQPADGSGDVFFHLDPLWARPSIAAVGIDNYMPLADWRDDDYLSGSPDGATGPYDPTALQAAITSGEGFDWYYASNGDREARQRTPITDGAYGMPWVFRYKDLVGWWSNPHVGRVSGVEQSSPTPWTPRGKPVWFSELGCPAVDKGPNQPNVFVDPKSSENTTPYFSNGGRNDLAPKRFLEAHAAHWDPAGSGFDPANNPLSPVYGGRMLDHRRSYVWCWDARPFPAFPLQADVWSDGANWHLGHWLNGRLEGLDVGSLINAILADHGLPAADVAQADGTLQGYVIDEPGAARSAIEPLVDLYDLAVMEGSQGLVFRSTLALSAAPLAVGEMVAHEDGASLEKIRTPDHELPAEAMLVYRDHMVGFQAGSVRSTRIGVTNQRQRTLSFPGVLEREQGQALIADWLDRVWAGRETAAFSVASYREGFEPGSVVTLPEQETSEFLVTEVEDGLVRRIKARRIARAAPGAWANVPSEPQPEPVIHAGLPHVLFLDLPVRSSTTAPQDQFRVAAWQKPWKSLVLLASPEDTGFSQRTIITQPSDIGDLVEPLPPGSFDGRIDRATNLTVALFDAEAASVSRLQLLNGANAAAVRAQNGVWEIVQFSAAEETAPGIWRLEGLLRGQLGTSDAMAAGAASGAPFVVLDDRIRPAGLLAEEIGLRLTWRAGRSGAILSDETFTRQEETGGIRARLPLSPVHLRCRRTGGDLAFSWVRRGRVDADDWAATEIPLGEDREEYRLDIAPPGGGVVRSATVTSPTFDYPAASIAADFGGLPPALDITVRQFSLVAGFGIPATRRFNF